MYILTARIHALQPWRRLPSLLYRRFPNRRIVGSLHHSGYAPRASVSGAATLKRLSIYAGILANAQKSIRHACPWHPLLHSSKWRRGPGRGGAEKNAPCRIASIRTLLPHRASSPRSAPVPGCSNVQTTADINSSCAPATLRATHACARLRDWNLEFLWSLDVGAWSFPP